MLTVLISWIYNNQIYISVPASSKHKMFLLLSINVCYSVVGLTSRDHQLWAKQAPDYDQTCSNNNTSNYGNQKKKNWYIMLRWAELNISNIHISYCSLKYAECSVCKSWSNFHEGNQNICNNVCYGNIITLFMKNSWCMTNIHKIECNSIKISSLLFQNIDSLA